MALHRPEAIFHSSCSEVSENSPGNVGDDIDLRHRCFLKRFTMFLNKCL